MKIYVGNLSYDVVDEDLKNAFSPFGEVAEAFVLKDKLSGRSKGFGFVEMTNQAEAEAAIEKMHGAEIKGRPVKVNEAKPKTEKGFHGNSRAGFQGGRGGNFNGPQGGSRSGSKIGNRSSNRGS
ncbi:MAG: RNA-binding protein [Candidatus Delongbacteria bacterium]|nr:RNA-binding protein [Candidatus Delongbacteria bacterium]